MSGRAWRFRLCPRCAVVRAASEFAVNETYRVGWKSGDMQRRCPECGFSAATFRFKVVRERHQAVVG